MANIGETLIEQGVITQEQLHEANAKAKAEGSKLPSVLVKLKYAKEEDLVRAFAKSLGMDFHALNPESFDPTAAEMLPAKQAEKLGVVPISFDDTGNRLLVAIADPKKKQLLNDIESAAGIPVELVLATKPSFTKALAHFTGNGSSSAPAPSNDVSPADRKLTLAPDTLKSRSEPEAIVTADERPGLDLNDILEELLDRGGSDLHLTAGISPSIRINGDLVQLSNYPRMMPDELQKTMYSIMTQKQRETFENELELDMSYAIPGKSRFRVNVFQQRDAVGAVMRVIPFEILPLEKLGIPDQVEKFAYLPRGFVLVTGPTGSGKSTTLASIIDLINRNRPAHIMTVEDPIEFLHQHKKSVINQREVGTDTHGFNQALKHVLRQDPDVILVGEMRDLETIQIALTAAETGHLVFGTLHTQDAPQTIDRVVDVFPPHQQEQIRVMLAGALKGVVCQTLLKRATGDGRIAACEIMVANSGIKNLIREGKTHQIYSAIQAGARDGMVAMDQTLASMVKKGEVTYDAALEKCSQINEFNRLVGRT